MGWFTWSSKPADEEGQESQQQVDDGGLGGFGAIDTLDSAADPRLAAASKSEPETTASPENSSEKATSSKKKKPVSKKKKAKQDDDSSDDDSSDGDEDDDQLMDLPGGGGGGGDDDASTVAGPLFDESDYSVAGGDDATVASYDTRTEDSWRQNKASDFLSDFFNSQKAAGSKSDKASDTNNNKKSKKQPSPDKQKSSSDPFPSSDPFAANTPVEPKSPEQRKPDKAAVESSSIKHKSTDKETNENSPKSEKASSAEPKSASKSPKAEKASSSKSKAEKTAATPVEKTKPEKSKSKTSPKSMEDDQDDRTDVKSKTPKSVKKEMDMESSARDSPIEMDKQQQGEKSASRKKKKKNLKQDGETGSESSEDDDVTNDKEEEDVRDLQERVGEEDPMFQSTEDSEEPIEELAPETLDTASDEEQPLCQEAAEDLQEVEEQPVIDQVASEDDPTEVEDNTNLVASNSLAEADPEPDQFSAEPLDMGGGHDVSNEEAGSENDHDVDSGDEQIQWNDEQTPQFEDSDGVSEKNALGFTHGNDDIDGSPVSDDEVMEKMDESSVKEKLESTAEDEFSKVVDSEAVSESRRASISAQQATNEACASSGPGFGDESGNTFAFGEDSDEHSTRFSEEDSDDDEDEDDDDDDVIPEHVEEDEDERVQDTSNRRSSMNTFSGKYANEDIPPDDDDDEEEDDHSSGVNLDDDQNDVLGRDEKQIPDEDEGVTRPPYGTYSSESTSDIDIPVVPPHTEAENADNVQPETFGRESSFEQGNNDNDDVFQQAIEGNRRPRKSRVDSDLSDPDGPDTGSMFDYIRKQSTKQAAFENESGSSPDSIPSLPTRNASLQMSTVEGSDDEDDSDRGRQRKADIDTMPSKPSRRASVDHDVCEASPPEKSDTDGKEETVLWNGEEYENTSGDLPVESTVDNSEVALESTTTSGEANTVSARDDNGETNPDPSAKSAPTDDELSSGNVMMDDGYGDTESDALSNRDDDEYCGNPESEIVTDDTSVQSPEASHAVNSPDDKDVKQTKIAGESISIKRKDDIGESELNQNEKRDGSESNSDDSSNIDDAHLAVLTEMVAGSTTEHGENQRDTPANESTPPKESANSASDETSRGATNTNRFFSWGFGGIKKETKSEESEPAVHDETDVGEPANLVDGISAVQSSEDPSVLTEEDPAVSAAPEVGAGEASEETEAEETFDKTHPEKQENGTKTSIFSSWGFGASKKEDTPKEPLVVESKEATTQPGDDGESSPRADSESSSRADSGSSITQDKEVGSNSEADIDQSSSSVAKDDSHPSSFFSSWRLGGTKKEEETPGKGNEVEAEHASHPKGEDHSTDDCDGDASSAKNKSLSSEGQQEPKEQVAESVDMNTNADTDSAEDKNNGTTSYFSSWGFGGAKKEQIPKTEKDVESEHVPPPKGEDHTTDYCDGDASSAKNKSLSSEGQQEPKEQVVESVDMNTNADTDSAEDKNNGTTSYFSSWGFGGAKKEETPKTEKDVESEQVPPPKAQDHSADKCDIDTSAAENKSNDTEGHPEPKDNVTESVDSNADPDSAKDESKAAKSYFSSWGFGTHKAEDEKITSVHEDSTSLKQSTPGYFSGIFGGKTEGGSEVTDKASVEESEETIESKHVKDDKGEKRASSESIQSTEDKEGAIEDSSKDEVEGTNVDVTKKPEKPAGVDQDHRKSEKSHKETKSVKEKSKTDSQKKTESPKKTARQKDLGTKNEKQKGRKGKTPKDVPDIKTMEDESEAEIRSNKGKSEEGMSQTSVDLSSDKDTTPLASVTNKETDEGSDSSDDDSSSSDSDSDSDSDSEGEDGKPYKLVVKEAPLLRLENVTSITRSQIPVDKMQKQNTGGTWGSFFSSLGLSGDAKKKPSSFGLGGETPKPPSSSGTTTNDDNAKPGVGTDGASGAVGKTASSIAKDTLLANMKRPPASETKQVGGSALAKTGAVSTAPKVGAPSAASTGEKAMAATKPINSAAQPNGAAPTPSKQIGQLSGETMELLARLAAELPPDNPPTQPSATTSFQPRSFQKPAPQIPSKDDKKKMKKEKKGKKGKDQGGLLGAHFKKSNVRKVSRHGDEVSVGTTNLKKKTGADQQHVALDTSREVNDEPAPEKGFRPWEKDFKKRRPAPMPKAEKGVNAAIVEEDSENEEEEENDVAAEPVKHDSDNDFEPFDQPKELEDGPEDSKDDDGDFDEDESRDALTSLSALERALMKDEPDEENFDDVWDTLSADVSTAIEVERKQRENFRRKKDRKSTKKTKKRDDDDDDKENQYFRLFESKAKSSKKKGKKEDDKISSDFLAKIREVFEEDSDAEENPAGTEAFEVCFGDMLGDEESDNDGDGFGSSEDKSISSSSKRSSKSKMTKASRYSTRNKSSSKKIRSSKRPKLNPAEILETEMRRQQRVKTMSVSSLKQEMSDRRGTSTTLLKKEFEESKRQRKEAASSGWSSWSDNEPIPKESQTKRNMDRSQRSNSFHQTNSKSGLGNSSHRDKQVDRWKTEHTDATSDLDDLKTTQQDAYGGGGGSGLFGSQGLSAMDTSEIGVEDTSSGLFASDSQSFMATQESPLGSLGPGAPPMGSLVSSNLPSIGNTAVSKGSSHSSSDREQSMPMFGMSTIAEDHDDDENERGLLSTEFSGEFSGDDDTVNTAARKSSRRFGLKAPKIGLGMKRFIPKRNSNSLHGSQHSGGGLSSGGDSDDNESLLG